MTEADRKADATKMLQKQKAKILSLVKAADQSKDYTRHYLLPYQDFFDVHDDFTDFQCERTAGKARYLFLIEQLLCTDKAAQVFVEVSSYEEDADDLSVCADTLIILSELPLLKVRQLFDVPDIFPSDVGALGGFLENHWIVDEDAGQVSLLAFRGQTQQAYFCWWD